MTIFVVAIGSLGIAGIPGTATMAASVGLSGVGMGAQFGMVSPILAIEPIIDMARTMINVTGSLTNALVVDKLMGNLNMDAYNDMSERIVGARSAEQSGIRGGKISFDTNILLSIHIFISVEKTPTYFRWRVITN